MGRGWDSGLHLPGWEPSFSSAVVGTGILDFNVYSINGLDYDELVPDDIPDDVIVTALFVGDGLDYGCC